MLPRTLGELAKGLPAMFGDESGDLGRDRVTTIGLVAVPEPTTTEQSLVDLRARIGVAAEVKYADNAPGTLPLCLAFLDYFAGAKDMFFCASISNLPGRQRRLQQLATERAVTPRERLYNETYLKAIRFAFRETPFLGMNAALVVLDPKPKAKVDNFRLYLTKNCPTIGALQTTTESHQLQLLQMADLLIGTTTAWLRGREASQDPIKRAKVRRLQEILGSPAAKTLHRSPRLGGRYRLDRR